MLKFDHSLNLKQVDIFRQGISLFLSKKNIGQKLLWKINLIYQYQMEVETIKYMKSGQIFSITIQENNAKIGLDLDFDALSLFFSME